jgi:hypothetical protein
MPSRQPPKCDATPSCEYSWVAPPDGIARGSCGLLLKSNHPSNLHQSSSNNFHPPALPFRKPFVFGVVATSRALRQPSLSARLNEETYIDIIHHSYLASSAVAQTFPAKEVHLLDQSITASVFCQNLGRSTFGEFCSFSTLDLGPHGPIRSSTQFSDFLFLLSF